MLLLKEQGNYKVCEVNRSWGAGKDISIDTNPDKDTEMENQKKERKWRHTQEQEPNFISDRSGYISHKKFTVAIGFYHGKTACKRNWILA